MSNTTTAPNYTDTPRYNDPQWCLDATIVHKFDWAHRWEEVETTFVPAAGEIVIYAFPSAQIDNITNQWTVASTAFKVGDGVSKLGQLKFTTNSNIEEWQIVCDNGETIVKQVLIADTPVGNVYTS